MLFEGRPGVSADAKRALELASAGVSSGGCPHSKGVLARCYVEGSNTTKKNEDIQEIAKGFALGRESAAMGSCFGQFVVGIVLLEGLCVEGLCVAAPDRAEAARWLQLAARQGLAGAQMFLAMIHLEDGDKAEAVRLLRFAAAQAFAPAQYNLGMVLHDGDAEDKAESKRLFSLASYQGWDIPCPVQ
jgi:TPR repeat protein